MSVPETRLSHDTEAQVKPNGGSAVNGRGLRHRKMSRQETVELAADIASGRPFVPSLHHLADIFGVSMRSLSEAVKARAAAQKVVATFDEVDCPELPLEPARPTKPLELTEEIPELSALTLAWYAASPEERAKFLCDEIVSRSIR